MKIQLFWFLTTASLVFAGFNRRAAQRPYERIDRRGDAYNQCVLSLIEEGTHNAEQAVPTAEECIIRFKTSIKESCLALYTDQDQDTRLNNMNLCFNKQASECKECMEAGGITPEDQSTVLGLLTEAREKMSNSDPEVGCADDL